MKFRSVIFVVISVLLVGAIHISSSPFQVFVEGAIIGGVSCSPQGGGKTYCCASVDEGEIYVNTTYCTTCDDTNPPSNCTPREKPKAVVNPGRDLSNILEGGVLEGATTLPEVSVLEGQRANISILPEGILQAENNLTFSQANISSSNSSNNTTPLEQSELMSDPVEKKTRNVDDGGQEQDESGTIEEGASEEADDARDEDKNDEE
jgi:hypothetical protein